MKLGVILDRVAPSAGGAEAHTYRLVEHALAKGHDVQVALLEGDAPVGATALQIDVPRRRPARDRAFASRGIAALRDGGADAVLAFRHAPGCDVYLPHGGLIGDVLGAKDRSRGRGRLHAFSRLLSAKARFFLEAEAALLDAEDGPTVVALSRALAARIAEVHPAAAGRVVVLPNGVDAKHFDPAPHREAGRALRHRLGIDPEAYVGLLLAHEPRLKGLVTALAALDRPELEHLDFHLLVGGSGGHGADARVHALGATADPRPLYAAADVLVHPTWYDPCSLACLEALAMEVPVVTTPQNGVSELMGHRGGIVIEHPGDPEALAVALRVLADPVLRAATGDDARWIAETHPQAKQFDRILELCASAAEATR